MSEIKETLIHPEILNKKLEFLKELKKAIDSKQKKGDLYKKYSISGHGIKALKKLKYISPENDKFLLADIQPIHARKFIVKARELSNINLRKNRTKNKPVPTPQTTKPTQTTQVIKNPTPIKTNTNKTIVTQKVCILWGLYKYEKSKTIYNED